MLEFPFLTLKIWISTRLCLWPWEQICNIFHNMPPGNHFTVSELAWAWPEGSLEWMMLRMQTHHLSHRARGQRYMWATVTCLKVTPPDKSNLLPWREWLDWCVSHLLAMPSQRSGIDGRAAWWAVPAPYLSVCLLLQYLGIYLTDNGPKQTDLTDWKLPAGFYTKCTVDVQWFNCFLFS